VDPAFHTLTGEPVPGRSPNPQASIPDHGDVYATALSLAKIDPKDRGRNTRSPLGCVKKGG
jgi:hypothetical protein